MTACPNCGKERESNRVECPDCQYTYRYTDVVDYDPEEIRFTVLFECNICGREFKLGFGEGDRVNIKGADSRTAKVNYQTGNQISILVDGWNCQPICPTCENDDSLSISEKRPVRER